jgi:hypothetical protein
MATLLLCPLTAGYSAKQTPGVLAVELDGGSARYRKDILHGSFRVTVSWACNGEQYEYLNAFHRTATVAGALPFDIALRLDDDALETFSAHFVPGTFGLSRTEGERRWVEAELEVVKPYDPGEAAADTAIIAAYEAAHGGSP